MPIVSLGTDLTQIARLESAYERRGERMLARLFTEAERAYCDRRTASRFTHYAGRFAVKEAVMKVLGTGWAEGVGFQQVEVVRDERGKPGVELTGEAAERAGRLGIQTLHLSLSHTADHAVAFVVAEGPETGS